MCVKVSDEPERVQFHRRIICMLSCGILFNGIDGSRYLHTALCGTCSHEFGQCDKSDTRVCVGDIIATAIFCEELCRYGILHYTTQRTEICDASNNLCTKSVFDWWNFRPHHTKRGFDSAVEITRHSTSLCVVEYTWHDLQLMVYWIHSWKYLCRLGS